MVSEGMVDVLEGSDIDEECTMTVQGGAWGAYGESLPALRRLQGTQSHS